MFKLTSIAFSFVLGSRVLLAQYTVQILPTPTGVGLVADAGGGQIVGSSFAGPALWNAPDYKFVSLSPKGYKFVEVFGVGGGKQVGYGDSGGARALMWSGSAGSVVDLQNDKVFLGSLAYGTDGKSQVGSGAVSQNVSHAAFWRGTAESAVDLHPDGYENSEAYGVWDDIQVGGAFNGPGGSGGAVMWRGTAESMQFLPTFGEPAGNARGIHGDQIVGRAEVSGISHAALWLTDGLSIVDLTPKGWGAIAIDTNGKQQVGFGAFAGDARALVWSGTAKSVVDLHTLLPGYFANSAAFGIDDNGVIAGYGERKGIGNVPIIWTPVPEPATIFIVGFGLLALAVRKRR